MAASRLLMCLPALILTIFARPASLTYADYDIASDRVCSRMGKRELPISLTRPLLVREGGRLLGNWPGAHSFSCRWEVEAKGRGLGVVAVIQRLRLRVHEDCIDHIKFREDGTSDSNRHICGSMLFGIPVNRDLNFASPAVPPLLPPTPPTTAPSTGLSLFMNIFKSTHNPWRVLASRGASVDPKGELKTYMYVANRALKGDDTLQLVVAYTAFQDCDGSRVPSTLFHCGYGLCISRLMVNDGVVNCPFGNCIDEGSCLQARESNLTAHILGHSTSQKDSGGVAPGIAATSSVFAIAIIVTIGACVCFLLKRSRRQRRDRSPSGGVSTYPAQGGNGDYMGVPLSAMGQSSDRRGDPLVPKPTVVPGMPGQPMPNQPYPQGGGSGQPIGFAVAPGAAYPSNIGAPYPYPGTGTPYPVQPPAAQQSAAMQGPVMPSAPPQEPPPPYSSLFPDN
ncbi:uncharacterized protein LOC124170012 [Ischnura elegans]|uniref:uncharacterized protein LOC124170012 n=1 Tax=Ischnura elegans TaxID=197161 RepID=UPI001ED88E24|nr:uncharacterized protein LOC124170012 [Ischnura elegans]